DITRVANEISKRTGGTMDVLVNDAAAADWTSPADGILLEAFFNVIGHYAGAVTRAFMPLLIKVGRGTILFTSSIASILCMPYNGSYGASKAAINALADTLRIELAPFEVKVVSVRGLDLRISSSALSYSHIIEARDRHNRVQPAAAAEFRRSLPGRSKPVEHSSFRDVFAIGTKGSTPTHVYAKAVIDEALRKSLAPWFWTGALSWFLSVFAWRGILPWDGIVSKQYGLNKLAEIVHAQKRV
ncbi:hypothetical protein GGF50DRAFT_60463, partial [Schizophyllum commune]